MDNPGTYVYSSDGASLAYKIWDDDEPTDGSKTHPKITCVQVNAPSTSTGSWNLENSVSNLAI